MLSKLTLGMMLLLASCGAVQDNCEMARRYEQAFFNVCARFWQATSVDQLWAKKYPEWFTACEQARDGAYRAR